MSLSAVNMGVSSKQMQYEQEQYFENPPRPQELVPFDQNVIMQTPVRQPTEAESTEGEEMEEEQSPEERHDVLY